VVVARGVVVLTRWAESQAVIEKPTTSAMAAIRAGRPNHAERRLVRTLERTRAVCTARFRCLSAINPSPSSNT
jgi:hypothetical protein